MPQSSTPAASDAIYDASSLGRPRMFLLGLQHLFAMFGATVLVPVLPGLSVSATLLFAGLGTLLFHFLSRGKVPAFLGSSFAFIAGYAAIAPNGETELLPYACAGRGRFFGRRSCSLGWLARRVGQHGVCTLWAAV